ncbi:UbiA family prenyltransferase [Marimonas lutisalis]|uniref:UbiA family prenyltransferase n=1 Tax=Marimonas lutisalis TaxID=2545756 RepID=UPI0010F47694|nr:UbiA family prenyltransferase [Marimonas lutisalis]
MVDLDGTLIRTDMLVETFWSCLSTHPFKAICGAIAAVRGKQIAKAILARHSQIDFASLPFEKAVLDLIRKHRENGGKTALVTAADEQIAKRISEETGLFDEVHGSTEQRNLKGRIKAEFLVERFGAKNFIYVGDSNADIPVWNEAAEAFVVGADTRLKERAKKTGTPTRLLKTRRASVADIIRAVRPHHALKNILIFVPLLTSQMWQAPAMGRAVIAFFAFSLIAFSVYLINDLLDLRSDRMHPKKMQRPFAAGDANLLHGSVVAMLLLFLGAVLSFFLGRDFAVIATAYFVLTCTYSLVLKRYIIIDIGALSVLYSLRIVAGSAATGIEISVWLMAFSMFFFLSLASVKRQAELVSVGEHGRHEVAGRGYFAPDLALVAQMALSSGFISVLVLALYINSPEILVLYKNPEVFWGLCAVLLYWLCRLVFLAQRGQMHEDPLIFAVRDRVSYFCGALFAVFLLLGV